MGFFDKDTPGAATLDRPKTEAHKTESASAPSLVANATPRSSTGSEGASQRPARPSSTSFRVRWTNQSGEVLSEYMQTLSATGKPMGMLNICRPEGWPAGQYKLEVLLNDTPAATMDLEVR
jgi:hypothetical protein